MIKNLRKTEDPTEKFEPGTIIYIASKLMLYKGKVIEKVPEMDEDSELSIKETCKWFVKNCKYKVKVGGGLDIVVAVSPSMMFLDVNEAIEERKSIIINSYIEDLMSRAECLRESLSRVNIEHIIGEDIPDPSNPIKSMQNVNDVIFPTRREAERMVQKLKDIGGRYGTVSVADFYDMISQKHVFVDNKHGWRELRDLEIVVNQNGYSIKFPQTIELD